jgi:hypothetical protein
MHLPRVRFTIRQMMAVVGLIAISLGISGMFYRGYRYRRIAEFNRLAAKVAAAGRKVAIWKATIDERLNEKHGAFRNSLLADWMGCMGSFHSELHRKYAQAAVRPWRLPEAGPPHPRREAR